jgi:hypothetical protein
MNDGIRPANGRALLVKRKERQSVDGRTGTDRPAGSVVVVKASYGISRIARVVARSFVIPRGGWTVSRLAELVPASQAAPVLQNVCVQQTSECCTGSATCRGACKDVERCTGLGPERNAWNGDQCSRRSDIREPSDGIAPWRREFVQPSGESAQTGCDPAGAVPDLDTRAAAAWAVQRHAASPEAQEVEGRAGRPLPRGQSRPRMKITAKTSRYSRGELENTGLLQ